MTSLQLQWVSGWVHISIDQHNLFAKCFFSCISLTQVWRKMHMGPCQWMTFPYTTHTHMHVCAWDFQPQSSPSVCAHSVPCFYWSRRCCGEKNNRNFICHWLSPLTVVSDVFYTHSTHIHIDTHTHRRAAVLTNVTHTLPSQRCYQDYNTVMDTSWNFIKFHTISVCVSMCFFLCVCVSVCLFWV